MLEELKYFFKLRKQSKEELGLKCCERGPDGLCPTFTVKDGGVYTKHNPFGCCHMQDQLEEFKKIKLKK